MYARASRSFWWTRDDTRRMVQAIHNYLRSPNIPRKDLPTALPLIRNIVDDIQSGQLAPHPYAHRDLLSIYKERREFESGKIFWEWLVHQDDTFVDPSVYGAAIELLAYRRDVSLQSLEDIFAQALKRFPGTFAEYHLSPDAIVPDRSQPFAVVGVPITLVQGILTARVLARDWKNAYLALDTALRLHPSTLPQRFFDLFVQERPISEGYTVFLIGCRAGISFHSRYLTTVLTRLKNSMPMASLEGRVTIVRAMTNAMYAYLQSGGTLEGPHISVLLHGGYTSILPQVQVGQECSEEADAMRSAIINSAHETASKLIQAGFRDTDSIFRSLISIAGHLNVPELFTVALNDAEASRTDLGIVGLRITLTAAGQLHDQAEIKRAWTNIAATALDRGETLARIDWLTLARACKRANMEHYFQTQLDEMKHAITVEVEKVVRLELSGSEPTTGVEFIPMDAIKFSEHMDGIRANIARMAAIIMSGQPLDLQRSPFAMYCDPTRQPFGGSMENLRAIYDELTTDPHQPSQETNSKEIVTSPTGIPLSELRFLNWVSIVDLMADAEEDELIWEKTMENAVDKNRRMVDIEYALNFERHLNMLKDRKFQDLSIRGLRSFIRSLRSPNSKSAEVASRILPPHKQRLKITNYVTRGSSHSTPDIRFYRPLSNRQSQESNEIPPADFSTTDCHPIETTSGDPEASLESQPTSDIDTLPAVSKQNELK